MADSSTQSRDGERLVGSYVRANVLEPDEQIVWQGRPDPAVAGRTQSNMIMSGLGMLVFGSLFIAISLASDDRGWVAIAIPALGAVFVALGLWMISGSVHAAWLALNSYYFISDRRVVIVKAGRRPRIVTIGRGEISDFVIERQNLILRKSRTVLVTRGTRRTAARTEHVRSPRFYDGLWGIDDLAGAARAVEALL